MFVKKYNSIEESPESFNSLNFCAFVAEMVHDYKTASFFYSKNGELYKAYQMTKLQKYVEEKDLTNKRLSKKFLERILSKQNVTPNKKQQMETFKYSKIM